MNRRDSKVSEDWYAGAFDALYPIVYSRRTIETAAPEAQFAARQTALCAADTLLDLCCGNGRHLAHLASRGRRCFGLDYSDALLRMARCSVPDATRLVRGDMRAFPFAPVFDVITNFFTSFGYFTKDNDNQRVLHEMGRVLKPGGRFFLDYLNPPNVRHSLVPGTVREEGPYTIAEERWIDSQQNRVNKKTTVLLSGVFMASSGESVKLYEEADMRTMLNAAGLEVDAIFGDYTGDSPFEYSPRRIYVGHKP